MNNCLLNKNGNVFDTFTNNISNFHTKKLNRFLWKTQ